MATSWLGASLMMRTATASLQMFNSHFDVYSTFDQNVGYYFYYSKKFIKKILNIALNLSLLSSSTPMMCTASSDWSQELKHTLGKTSNEK